MAAEDYVGPPGHEKKFHKDHFAAPGVRLLKRQNGDTKRINGTLYTWHDGRWTSHVRDATGGHEPEVTNVQNAVRSDL